MSLIAAITEARQRRDGDLLTNAIPYARLLGLKLETKGNELTCAMPFSQVLVGNPVLPALHGGSVGGMMECAAILHLLWNMDSVSVPKTVDFSVDYLRSARAEDTYARAIMVRMGARVANLRVEAWQSDVHKPIAIGIGNFLLKTN
ncbi:MAG: hypothetical protein AMXMBFR6_21540 [Betaproteobacteria bacterium]|jgi:acyl-coenzyme A thioesterase PaaI-like protein|nr:PaaI family thioesterase [Rhodocyclaceae bacterium]